MSSFDQAVRALAAELPFDQARAVWLVDSCGLSYDQTASAMATEPAEIARIIADARRRVRQGLMANGTGLALH